MEIVELSTKANKRLLTDSSTHRVQQILREAMTQPNFGNMRFARSLVEKAVLRQAGRVMALPAEQVTDSPLMTLGRSRSVRSTIVPLGSLGKEIIGLFHT